MNTRTRRSQAEQDHSLYEERPSSLELETFSDDDVEALLFDETEEEPRGFWNLPTAAGLSLILVGVAYLFQELGIWNGFDLSVLVGMLPWLAGVLIILLGFGVLSWRPSKRKKRIKKGAGSSARKQKIILDSTGVPKEKKRLVKSPDKKIAGVCGGIAEYFNLDPTLVRIAFVIGTIATQGSFLLAYLVLSFVMPKPEKVGQEERITIVRDI